MAYSTIIQKRCKCDPGCQALPSSGYAGYNWAHAPQFVVAIVDGKKEKQIKKTEANKREVLRIRKLNTGDIKPGDDLQRWYAAAAIELARHPFCIECKAIIHRPYFRASTAHILPKRKQYGCPSVATHPANKLFLGAECGCHYRYDSSWQAASQMIIWPMAIIAFEEMYPFIYFEERKNIPEALLKTLDNG